MFNEKGIIAYLEQIVLELKDGKKELVNYRFTRDVECPISENRIEFEIKTNRNTPTHKPQKQD